jgi:hypothetical protein
MRLVLASLVLLASMTAVSHAQRRTPRSVLVFSAEQGILEVDPRTAAVTRVVTPTHAAVARYSDPEHVLFLVDGTNQLRELDVRRGQHREIATLPGDVGLGCGGTWGSDASGEARHAPYLVSEQLMFAQSMAVDTEHACFEVMDRNLNMASVVVQIEVSLRSNAVRSWITWVLEEAQSCTAISEAEEEALPCTQLLRRRAREANTRGRPRPDAYTLRDLDDGARGLLAPPQGQARRLAITAPMIETISPDGRWAVLGGNREEGDSIYRSLWIVDLTRGSVFGLHGWPELATEDERDAASTRAVWPWPRPIPQRTLADADRMGATGFGATGETSVRWMGNALVLGETLLVTPGRSIVRLPGPIVW